MGYINKRMLAKVVICLLGLYQLSGCGGGSQEAASEQPKLLADVGACSPAWVSTTVYVAPTTVSYQGVNYTSNYYSVGKPPATNTGATASVGQPWITGSVCMSGGTTSTIATTTTTTAPLGACSPAWVSTTVYLPPTTVSYLGVNYTANYYSVGRPPATNAGATASVGQPWITGLGCLSGGTTQATTTTTQNTTTSTVNGSTTTTVIATSTTSTSATTTTTSNTTTTTQGGNTTHVLNPFDNTNQYLSPDYAALIDKSIATESSDPALVAKMKLLKNVPTAIWLDRIEAITGGVINSGRLGLQAHLLQALAQQNALVAAGSTKPMLVTIVVYDLPDRDCAALASNGSLHGTAGLATYKTGYIDVIASILADPRFSALRIAAIIEPDSLPNMVTNNISKFPVCQAVASARTYEFGVQYALNKLHAMSNVYTYLDIGHSGWLGWPSNSGPAAQYFKTVVAGAANGDMSLVDGFVSNTANTTPTTEPFLPNPDLQIGGAAIKSATFFEWNPIFDEVTFASLMKQLFVAQGFSPNIAMLIDTSRNGWGGAARPVALNPTPTTVSTYVDANRVDRRFHRGNWCNPSGAGIGQRPQANPFGASSPVRAFVWIKPPGESDGTSQPQSGPDSEGKSSDPMCSPAFITSAGLPTGAMPNAPAAGAWFHNQFKALIQNAYPVIQ